MILVSELTKTFGKENDKKTVLDKTSWDVANGIVAGLIGRSGSGKTATLRILAGIQNPTHGRVLLENQDITENPVEAKMDLAFIPDSVKQFQGLTGEEYLSFVADVYQVSEGERKKLLPMYVKRLGLELYLKERMATYSKANYKKTMLLGALLHQPRNLVLDNFFDGLSDSDTEEVKKILKEYARNSHAVLFSDARLRTVENLCDKVIVLQGGKVFFQGSVELLLEKYSETASLDMIDLLINKGTDKILSEKGGD